MADFGLQEMLFWVKQKKAEELDEILKVIVLRYSELLPEQELVCMFLPKNAPEKKKMDSISDRVFLFSGSWTKLTDF